MAANNHGKFILWLNEIGIGDVPLVVVGTFLLEKIYQKLNGKGIRVPNGFAITACVYRYFLKYAGIEDEIKKVLKNLDASKLDNLMRNGAG